MVPIINNIDRNPVFDSLFVNSLLTQFWESYQNLIVFKLLMPYFVYMMVNLTFLVYSIDVINVEY